MKTTTKLSKLSIGQKFSLKTKRFYLRLHEYVVLEKNGEFVTYGLVGLDKYNQRTIVNGNSIAVVF